MKNHVNNMDMTENSDFGYRRVNQNTEKASAFFLNSDSYYDLPFPEACGVGLILAQHILSHLAVIQCPVLLVRHDTVARYSDKRSAAFDECGAAIDWLRGL